MPKYIIRLDDACERRDINKWNQIEALLDKYSIKPLVGIIPYCEDEEMLEYEIDNQFECVISQWIHKGWTIAMHGYNHVYSTKCGGINPVNSRSEFAGEGVEVQKDKIVNGVSIMRQYGIEPKVFFAPSHTFDENTLVALKECSNIRVISDTIANKPYVYCGITFVPQQSGRVRALPFSVTTFCYHPNMMDDKDFAELEKFLLNHQSKFISFPMEMSTRKRSWLDKILNYVYMRRHK